jgi:hypothetical protein
VIYINFNFDFHDLHNLFFQNYFANELTRSFVFESIQNMIEQLCFIKPKDTWLRLVFLYLIKHALLSKFKY